MLWHPWLRQSLSKTCLLLLSNRRSGAETLKCRTAETPNRHGSHVRSGFDGTLSGSGATHGTAGRGTGIDVRIASCDCSSRCCSDLGIESKIESKPNQRWSRAHDWGRPWTLLRLCSFTFREWLDEQIWKLTKLKNLISQKMMRIWNILGLVLKFFFFFFSILSLVKRISFGWYLYILPTARFKALVLFKRRQRESLWRGRDAFETLTEEFTVQWFQKIYLKKTLDVEIKDKHLSILVRSWYIVIKSTKTMIFAYFEGCQRWKDILLQNAFHFVQTKVEWQKVLLLKMEVGNEKTIEDNTFPMFFDSKKLETWILPYCDWEI